MAEQAPRISAAPATRLPLPNELQEEIFDLLDAADVAKAAAACTSFRKIIVAPSFLRRLPPPRLLGFLEDEGHSTPCLHSFHHNSAPVARFVAGAADFALSFLPDHPNLWRIRDASDGRILLSHASRRPWDLVVCDPLHRSYVRVPQIPDHVAAGARRPLLVRLPRSGGRRGGTTAPGGLDDAPRRLSYRYYAHGCFYWTFWGLDTALMLDMREMNFSIFQLPRVIVTWQDNGVGAAADWNLTRTTPLPDDSLKYKIVGAADGYLLLQAFPKHFASQQTPQARYFTLKLETLLIEELFVSLNKGVRNTYLYVNFPPPLALPSI
ncbi:unnamed protein product [Urochloa decumbens]|uniref:F-box domain-containing protein n=1 Tax=Urochloa decumbens TaxID=240449 RepID=A0ABC8VJR2_9POAL